MSIIDYSGASVYNCQHLVSHPKTDDITMTSNNEFTRDRGTPTPNISPWYKDYDTVIQPPHRSNTEIIPLYQRRRVESSINSSPISIFTAHSTHQCSCEEKDTQLLNKEDAPVQK
eukprot:CAMPEP_0198268414 /NCGR_PEP_ID=MMETSP1447-20131203/37160_1 /TAXON_ID=420782 /ORGANISM="Chaetoceros dichaeta, Strain CCMP1751" /LENGTH=114 /DNA_ID=CAMNT_0043959449 /DNA_START=556 /DNA_END=897 /DNA_ORIENTATION=-